MDSMERAAAAPLRSSRAAIGLKLPSASRNLVGRPTRHEDVPGRIDALGRRVTKGGLSHTRSAGIHESHELRMQAVLTSVA